eukprot:15315-Heterococcus_DN1.PRE.1
MDIESLSIVAEVYDKTLIGERKLGQTAAMPLTKVLQHNLLKGSSKESCGKPNPAACPVLDTALAMTELLVKPAVASNTTTNTPHTTPPSSRNHQCNDTEYDNDSPVPEFMRPRRSSNH